MDELTPEEFEKSEKKAQDKRELMKERALAKGMSEKEYMEMRNRAELKASKDIAALEKRIDKEARTYKDLSTGQVRVEPKLGSAGVGAGIDIEGLPKKIRPGPKNMKQGGMTRSIDGIAQRGKTRAKRK
jgi:hypothetical protein